MINKPVMKPWGLSRATDFAETVELGYTSVEIDPVTQMGRYRDAWGSLVDPLEASPKHGSGTTTRPRTATGQDGGRGPAPDNDTGYDGDRD